MEKEQILKTLADFIKIESVSVNPKKRDQIKKAVSFLKKKLRDLGFTVQLSQINNSPPLIIGSRLIDRKEKTIAIYGHYDVQPEDPLNEWQTPPFKLVIQKGKLFGRGVADNKGPIIQNLSAVEQLIKTNQMKNNLIFILEGEEETGSPHLKGLIKKAAPILKQTDVFYITDVGMHNKQTPQIFYGLRGLVGFELEISIGKRDLHSGIYGNRVLNPIIVLSHLIAKIKELKKNHILIPGFYNNLRQPSEKELRLLSSIKKTDKEELEETGVYSLTAVDKKHPFLSTKIYPSFDCHGILSGYTQKGIKTIIPKSAKVKFSFRLVEYQNPETIEKLVKGFIKTHLPKGLKYKLTTTSKNPPFYTALDNPFIKTTAKILKAVFKNKVVFNRSGGSIPAAEIFNRVFKKPVVLTGFTLPDDNIHSPNENFDIETFFLGIKALKKIYSQQ